MSLLRAAQSISEAVARLAGSPAGAQGPSREAVDAARGVVNRSLQAWLAGAMLDAGPTMKRRELVFEGGQPVRRRLPPMTAAERAALTAARDAGPSEAERAAADAVLTADREAHGEPLGPSVADWIEGELTRIAARQYAADRAAVLGARERARVERVARHSGAATAPAGPGGAIKGDPHREQGRKVLRELVESGGGGCARIGNADLTVHLSRSDSEMFTHLGELDY